MPSPPPPQDPADAVSVVNVSSYQGRRLLESEAKLAGCGGGGGGGGGGREEGKRTSYIRLEGVDAAGNVSQSGCV